MDRHTIILTADKRQEKLANLLEGERISYAWEENAQEKEVCEKVYVLPIPVTKLDRNPTIKEKLKEEIKRCDKSITISSLKLNNLEKIKQDIDCSENFFHSNKIKCIRKAIFFTISATLLSLLLSLINPTIFASISLLSSLTCFTIIESLVYFNKTKNIKLLLLIVVILL